MKKRLGLGLGLLAVCTMVACNDSSDSVTTPSWGNGQQQGTANNGQINEDSLRQAMLDSINNALNQLSSASVDLFSSASNLLQSSSSGLVLSSSQIAGLSSSSLGLSSQGTVPPSSSSTVAPKSSTTVPKSSATVVDDGTIKLELWDGSEAHVPVGNQKGGWWYTYDDNESGGASVIAWKAEPGDDGDMTPVIEACGGGICGSFSLDQGAYEWDPFVGFAFGFGANNAFSGDASALGGICVTYYSDQDIMLELGLTGPTEKKIGYANPFATLAASGSPTTVNLTWASFKQPKWYTDDETKTVFITGAEAAEELSSLKFKITGADGDSGDFGVSMVGPRGKCK